MVGRHVPRRSCRQVSEHSEMTNSEDIRERSAPMAVVIVTYNSADVIEDCLDSLLASEGADLRVIVVDNKSPDASIDTVLGWAERNGIVAEDHAADAERSSSTELPWLTLIRSPINKGFAGGVNIGLRWALPHSEIDLFWVLNPDCIVEPQTAKAFADCAAKSGEFSLMGGRVVYPEPIGLIQSDGGRINSWGACYSVNQGMREADAVTPSVSDLDFISGANMIASRSFIDAVGMMNEDYFLYYEEVDWAARRGDLPLSWCQEARTAHHVGTSIGSGSFERQASPLSEYFNNRNRMRFVWRHRRAALPLAYTGSMLRAMRLALLGNTAQAFSALCGTNSMPPPRSVAEKFSKETWPLAFGKPEVLGP
jgi:GT2 family glycosyltransferase